MRPERFTEQAREMLSASQELVRGYRHSQWDVEHILLALLEQESGLINEILQKLGVDIAVVKGRLHTSLDSAPKTAYEAEQMYATPRVARLLDNAAREADVLKDDLIGTEHILIAIAAEGRGEAVSILKESGIDQERLYHVLREIRSSYHVDLTHRQLRKYGYDLTKIANEGSIEPLTGRDSEVQQIIQVLGRKSKNSPLLVGEPNIDTFSIVEELARRIVNSDVPSFLQGRKIIALDLGKLVAGAKFRGEFEERIEAVLEEIKQSRGLIIPYFDELWIGVAEGGLGLASMLKYPLAMGQFQCIGSTLPKYLEYLGEVGMLRRQFEVIAIVACSV